MAAMSVLMRDPWSTPAAIDPARWIVAPRCASRLTGSRWRAGGDRRLARGRWPRLVLDAGWSVTEVDRTPPMREAAAMNLWLWAALDYRRTGRRSRRARGRPGCALRARADDAGHRRRPT
ncbi:MAG: hypothetical protein R3E48_18485 [Burkholderiaceae bacterium]